MIKGSNGGVTWKYVGGAAIGLVILGGSGWLTFQQSQLGGVSVAVEKTKEKLAEQTTDQAVTKTKVQDIDRKVDEVRKDVADIKSTLQQILINQQIQQLREQPKR
jgi:septal ring factor EnvC (AmiA/AmiB activator)